MDYWDDVANEIIPSNYARFDVAPRAPEPRSRLPLPLFVAGLALTFVALIAGAALLTVVAGPMIAGLVIGCLVVWSRD